MVGCPACNIAGLWVPLEVLHRYCWFLSTFFFTFYSKLMFAFWLFWIKSQITITGNKKHGILNSKELGWKDVSHALETHNHFYYFYKASYSVRLYPREVLSTWTALGAFIHCVPIPGISQAISKEGQWFSWCLDRWRRHQVSPASIREGGNQGY